MVISIYQHYREDERPFVDQVLEWKDEVKVRHQERLSDFLDPREQQILKSIIGLDEDVNLAFLGGSPYAERCRARLTPSYLESTEEDFQLTLFQIDYAARFVTLEHRDILGALMNLGIKREKFGDIFINDGIVQLVTATEIADFIQLNIEKIGKASVKLKEIPLTEQIKPKEEWKEATTTVSSMRLDVVLAQIYNLSRTKVLPYIEKGVVKVNWKRIDRPNFLLQEGDYTSLRGFGRAQLLETIGVTKKDKIRLRYQRLV